jgi:hypothetical protein
MWLPPRVSKVVVAVVFGLVIGIVILVTSSCLNPQSSPRAVAAPPADNEPHVPRLLEEVVVLPDVLNESSGLAVSRTQPGVLWSHNDSGDGPNLYAIDLSGRVLATIPVGKAAARDWEDIASGPCPAGLAATPRERRTPSCLYVADIGDNDRVRKELTVYVLAEPRLAAGNQKPAAAVAQSFRYRYPDQPQDSEAFAVLPNGDATIVTKGRVGTIEFFGLSGAAIARALTSGELLTASPQGDTGIVPNQSISRLVTAAAVSPDGTTLAVRTYREVYFYGLTQGREGRRWRHLGQPCFLDDAEPQGEAIDYLDADTLLLTSERSRGRPGTIHRLQC